MSILSTLTSLSTISTSSKSGVVSKGSSLSMGSNKVACGECGDTPIFIPTTATIDVNVNIFVDLNILNCGCN